MKKLFTLLFSMLTLHVLDAQNCGFPYVPSINCDATYSNVVINEVSGDSGQSDSTNDAIVELAGPAGTNIGCMVLSNGEWALVLPAGTTIPADGVFMIGCSYSPNNGSFSTNGSGLTCADCDFAGLTLDFDLCDSANQNYVSSSMFGNSYPSNNPYGFTLDNGACAGSACASCDGDQLVLFTPTGDVNDAVYWGKPDVTPGGISTFGGSSGSCGSPADHISVQDGSNYLLGDNDENGVVNDVIQPHDGRKGDGGNATGVQEMPDGDCNASQNCFVMPGLPTTPGDPSSVWIYAGCSFTSCNSSYIRITGSDGSHCADLTESGSAAVNPSHMDDPDLDADWAGIPSVANVSSSCALDGDNDNAEASTQWGYTDHPTPGEPNDVDIWDFFYDVCGSGVTEIMDKGVITLNVCCADPVTFSLNVYNYQQVEPTISSDPIYYPSGAGNGKDGSRVEDNNGVIQPWTITQVGSSTASTAPAAGGASANDGTTIMTFTSGALNSGINNFQLVWDDYTDCCGSTAGSTGGECYETISVIVNVAQELTSLPGNIDCGTDPTGLINSYDFISGLDPANQNVLDNGDFSYELFSDNPPTTSVTTSTSGNFLLNTLAGTQTYTVVVTDNSGCYGPYEFTVQDNCEVPPICPENFEITVAGNTTAAAACPEDVVEICFSGESMQTGGAIILRADEDDDGVYETEVCSEAIPSPPPQPCPEGEVYIASIDNDGPGGGSDPAEYVEICYAGCDPCPDGTTPPGIDLSGWILDDNVTFGSGTPSVAINSGVLASGACVQITSVRGAPQTANGITWTVIRTSTIWNNGGDGIFLSDDAGALIDSETDTDGPSGQSSFTAPTVDCTPDPGADSTQEICCDYTVPAICPSGNINFQGEVEPFDAANCPDAAPDEPDATFEFTAAITVSCPVVTLSAGEVSQCVGDGAIDITVNITNGPADITYTLNGVATTVTGLATGAQTINVDAGAVSTGGTVTAILDASVGAGGGCIGTVDATEFIYQVYEAPMASITTCNDITDCDPVNDPIGNGTVEINFTGDGPYIVDYTIDGAGPFQASFSTVMGIINIPFAGNVELVGVTNENGCDGTIGNNNCDVNYPAAINTVATFDVGPICNNGAVTVVLDSDVTITPPATGAVTWYGQNPTGLSDLAKTLIPPLASTTISGITADSTLYYEYADATTQCTVVGNVELITNPALCVFDLALIKEFGSTNDIALPTGISPGDEITYNVSVFNQGIFTAYNIEVTDYFPTPDLAWVDTDEAGATLTTTVLGTTVTVTDNSNGVYTIDSLLAGDRVMVQMTYTIDPNFMGTQIINNAEITDADDNQDPNDTPPTDIDSTPGDNNGDAPELTDGIDNNPDNSNDGTTDNNTNPENVDDYDPELLMILQPCPDPSFTCTISVDLCGGELALNALDLGTNGTAVTDGTWSGSGSAFIILNGAGVADDVLNPTGTSVGTTYILTLEMVNNGCVETFDCTFSVFSDCAAEGGSFGN